MERFSIWLMNKLMWVFSWDKYISQHKIMHTLITILLLVWNLPIFKAILLSWCDIERNEKQEHIIIIRVLANLYKDETYKFSFETICSDVNKQDEKASQNVNSI